MEHSDFFRVSPTYYRKKSSLQKNRVYGRPFVELGSDLKIDDLLHSLFLSEMEKENFFDAESSRLCTLRAHLKDIELQVVFCWQIYLVFFYK